LSETPYSSKLLLTWWNCALVTLYKKFVLKNVKFQHIIKVHKVPKLFPNRKFRIVRSLRNNYDTFHEFPLLDIATSAFDLFLSGTTCRFAIKLLKRRWKKWSAHYWYPKL